MDDIFEDLKHHILSYPGGQPDVFFVNQGWQLTQGPATMKGTSSDDSVTCQFSYYLRHIDTLTQKPEPIILENDL